MKFLIASDIHGSAKYCGLLLQAFKRENADKLLLLGDILYHGPRNPLPDEYNPQLVAQQLNEVKEKILCVRGNCDAEVDQMLLQFNCLTDCAAVVADGVSMYLAHGHKPVPPLCDGDVYLSGHTHVPKNSTQNGCLFLNPGSVSLPKENSERGYILYENRVFTFKTLDGKIYDTKKV